MAAISCSGIAGAAAPFLLENRALRPVPERSMSLKLLLFPVSLAARTSLLNAEESLRDADPDWSLLAGSTCEVDWGTGPAAGGTTATVLSLINWDGALAASSVGLTAPDVAVV
jgi:hypothetical protein